LFTAASKGTAFTKSQKITNPETSSYDDYPYKAMPQNQGPYRIKKKQKNFFNMLSSKKSEKLAKERRQMTLAERRSSAANSNVKPSSMMSSGSGGSAGNLASNKSSCNSPQTFHVAPLVKQVPVIPAGVDPSQYFYVESLKK
jgi:hypothetical protein